MQIRLKKKVQVAIRSAIQSIKQFDRAGPICSQTCDFFEIQVEGLV